MIVVVLLDSLVGCLTVTPVHFVGVLIMQSTFLVYEYMNPDIYDTFGLDFDWLPEFTLTIMLFSFLINTVYIRADHMLLNALGDPFNQIL